MIRALAFSILGLMALATVADRAAAATMEQAMAQCKEQVTPIVRACVREKMMANRDNKPDAYLAGCRAPVMGQVKACVAKLIGAAGFKNQPIEAAKESPTLRQASVAVLDGAGFVDEKGQTLFTYAHPLFWAPYSIIGDGG